MKLTKEMEMATDRENIYIKIGLKYYNNDSRPAVNYIPTRDKHGVLISAYFTPPNIIGLCGVFLLNNRLTRLSGASEWIAPLSHETIHYTLCKYVSIESHRKFDRICPPHPYYSNDGFSLNREGKKHKEELKKNGRCIEK